MASGKTAAKDFANAWASKDWGKLRSSLDSGVTAKVADNVIKKGACLTNYEGLEDAFTKIKKARNQLQPGPPGIPGEISLFGYRCFVKEMPEQADAGGSFQITIQATRPLLAVPVGILSWALAGTPWHHEIRMGVAVNSEGKVKVVSIASAEDKASDAHAAAPAGATS